MVHDGLPRASCARFAPQREGHGQSTLDGELLSDDGITIVHSWDDVLKILDRDLQTHDHRYNAMGHLEAPCERVDEIFERIPEREAWWQGRARRGQSYAVLGGVPQFRSRADRDHVFEYLYEFVSMLLAEIIASPEAESAYFSEQLSWFHAGHLPCGWEGDWPDGRMRVFEPDPESPRR